MKKSPSLLITLLIVGTSLASALLVNQSPKSASASSDEQITQTYLYNEMVGFSSSISGNDITDNIDPNQLIDYGFRHGNVKTNEIHKFDTFGDNRLGIEGTKAAFLNWKMQTCQSDGGIIKLTANKKVSVTILREKIGNDWKDDITLSIFKNSTLLEEKELKDSTTISQDFTFNTVLDVGETLYWQIYSTANENRIIGMDSSGADWSTLPKFVVTEYIEYPNTTKTIESIANDLYNSSTAVVNDSSNLFSFKGSYGDIENSLEYPHSKGENKLKLGNSSLSLDGKFTLKANSNLFFTFTAKGTISIKFNWSSTISNYEGLTFKFYMDINNKTKQALYIDNVELSDIELMSKTFVIHDAQTVKLYIKNSGGSLVENLELLKSIYVEKLPSNTAKISDYPIYAPLNYQNENTISHKDLALESAKLKCEAIKLKDGLLTLTTGTVNEEKTDLRAFDTIRYDDGLYLYNKSVEPSFVLAGPSGTFNSDDQAVVEDYRLQTSVSEAVVYKFEATTNTELKITHDATSGGWVGDGVYIEALQNNGKITKSLSKKVVNSANEAADTYLATYHLKKGDVAYYVFGSDMALRRNLNIAPRITTNANNYDPAQREAIFGVSLVNAYLYQTVTDTINNNYQPVTYEDTLTVTLGHGSYEDISLFKSSKGEGKGSADDALFVGTGTDSDVGFQRWQFRAGLMNDNAIMKFTAEKNTKLDITHIPMVLFYNTGASIRYYIQDVDNFIEFKEERFISADTPENYYGYSVNLKAKQSLILEFSANDPEGYAVASIEWVAVANTKEYDETKINDFTEARDLQNFKNNLINEMELYVASLRKVDYTVSNYAQIEAYLEQFITEIKTLLNRDEIQALYNEIHNKIDNVLTIEEEEQLLVEAKEVAITEALNYINERKNTFTKSQWEDVLEEYNTFKLLVEMETSVTNINVLLIQFKTTINSLPATAVKENKMRNLIIGISVPASILLIAGIATPIIVINVRKLKKTEE